MYHADRDKGKCDLHGGRRQGLVEWEGQIQPEIERRFRLISRETALIGAAIARVLFCALAVTRTLHTTP